MRKAIRLSIAVFFLGVSPYGLLLGQTKPAPTSQLSSNLSSKLPPKPEYPAELQEAISKFQTTLAPMLEDIKNAREKLDEQIAKQTRETNQKMLAMLKAEHAKAVAAGLPDAETLNDFLALCESGQASWQAVPSERIRKAWKKENTQNERNLKRYVLAVERARMLLDKKVTNAAKPVLRTFDRQIGQMQKAKQTAEKITQWEDEKREFSSGLQRYRYDPDLLLLLTFDRDTIFEKDGQFYAEDLSGNNRHCRIVSGRLFPSPRGAALRTSNKVLGGWIPACDDFNLDFPKGSTLMVWFYLPKDLPQKTMYHNCPVQYGSWCVSSPGTRVNSIMAGALADKTFWVPKGTFLDWNSLIWWNIPAQKKQVFMLNGTVNDKTFPTAPIKPKPMLFVGKSFTGKIDEIRLYRGLVSQEAALKILRESKKTAQ